MHEERTIAVDGLVILVLENHLAADPAGGSGQILSDWSNEDVRIRRQIGFWC